MDIYEEQAGRGVGGRMVDVLNRKGITANAISVSGISDFCVASSFAQIVLKGGDVEKFDPISEVNGTPEIILDKVKEMNSISNMGTSLFGETWASLLHQGLHENEILFNTLSTIQLDTTFSESPLGVQLESVAKMIKSRASRSADRDVFFVRTGGFDTHAAFNQFFEDLSTDLNTGLTDFTAELKQQGAWDSVTIIMASEFARTLTMNSGLGTDHAVSIRNEKFNWLIQYSDFILILFLVGWKLLRHRRPGGWREDNWGVP